MNGSIAVLSIILTVFAIVTVELLIVILINLLYMDALLENFASMVYVCHPLSLFQDGYAHLNTLEPTTAATAIADCQIQIVTLMM